MRRMVVLALAGCLVAGGVRAQVLEVESLDAFVDGEAAEPSVASLGADRFVVTWQSRLKEGVTALRFREIDHNGRPGRSGEIARGRGWFVNWADFPSLAVLDNGDWIAHWLQRSGPGYAYDVRVVRSTGGGRHWWAPVTPHDDGTRSEHGFVSLMANGGDTAVAVWLDGRHTQGQSGPAHDHGDEHAHGQGRMTLRAARLDRDHVLDAAELDGSVCDCCQTDAVRVRDDILVAYRGRSDDEIRDVNLVRHDGTQWQSPMPLFADGWRIAGCPVNGPALAAHGQQVVAVAYTEADGTPQVRLRTSSDGGRSWRPALTIAEGGTLGRLDAAALPAGRFVVSRLDADAQDAHLRVSLHDKAGATLDTRTLANLPAQRMSGFPRMAAAGDHVLIAWTDPSTHRPQVQAALLRVRPAGPAQGLAATPPVSGVNPH